MWQARISLVKDAVFLPAVHLVPGHHAEIFNKDIEVISDEIYLFLSW